MNIPESLTNHFLIAMPALKDTFFSKSVVYLYEHGPNGAMGLVVNKSLQISLENLLHHLEIDVLDQEIAGLPVFTGGPVSPEQGFVIHDQIEKDESEEEVMISASKEILMQISDGNGPENFIVILGYSGWKKDQLESEIMRNDWLVAPFNREILFSVPIEQRWTKAAETIGIDINQLGDQFGHA